PNCDRRRNWLPHLFRATPSRLLRRPSESLAASLLSGVVDLPGLPNKAARAYNRAPHQLLRKSLGPPRRYQQALCPCLPLAIPGREIERRWIWHQSSRSEPARLISFQLIHSCVTAPRRAGLHRYRRQFAFDLLIDSAFNKLGGNTNRVLDGVGVRRTV